MFQRFDENKNPHLDLVKKKFENIIIPLKSCNILVLYVSFKCIKMIKNMRDMLDRSKLLLKGFFSPPFLRVELNYCYIWIFFVALLSCSVFDGDGPEEKDPCIFCGGSFFATDSEPAWSPDGNTIAYVGADSVGELGIYLINPDGKNKRLVHSGNVGAPSWSPDNNWLIFHENAQIFKKHIETDSLVQLTLEGRNFFPDWSPDGEWIAYDSNYESLTGLSFLWKMQNNGSEKLRIVFTPDQGEARTPSWSSDSKKIVHIQYLVGVHSSEIFSVNSDGSNPIRLIENEATDYYPKYSPDGRRLLFTSQPYASQMNIYLMDLSDESMKQLTREGGYTNDWSPDGAWIVYTETSETGRLWLMKPDGSEKKQLTYED